MSQAYSRGIVRTLQRIEPDAQIAAILNWNQRRA